VGEGMVNHEIFWDFGDPIFSWPIFAKPIMPAVVDQIQMGSNYMGWRRPAPKMRRRNKASRTLQGLEH